MDTKDVKLVAFGAGDRTVGDGTFHAELTITALPSDLMRLAKAEFQRALSTVWDLRSSRVTVMTQEEFEAYTKEESCGCWTSDPLLHCTPCCNGPDCDVCLRGASRS